MRVDESLYRACRAYLGGDRGEPLPDPYELTGDCARRLPDPPSCVYIAADAADEALYVGSVHRSAPGGLAARLREHLREPAKTRLWRRVWVLPVRASASPAALRRFEGRIGARVAPTRQARLPRY